MRLFFTIILGTMLVTCPAWGQQEDNVAVASFALQQVLSTLKDGVEKLNTDNDQLALQDESIKQQVVQMQTQLGRVEAQGDDLNRAVDKLRAPNPGRAQQIARLEKENSALDERIQQTQDSAKSVQESLDAGYQEDQRLLLQLKGMSNALPLPYQIQSPGAEADARRQKEKLTLIKMIYESQQRQASLHEAILEFQKNTPLLPAAGAWAHQQFLKGQVKDLESQIAQYPPETLAANTGPANQWDDTQLGALEMELKALEKNYSQLRNLMGEMTQKTKSSRMTVSQQVEGEKLQGSIDDLNRQSEGLRANLDDLRSQMVDLDKRKSNLEEMIKQMP